MSTDATLRLHHFLPISLANGPGARAVIWVQGCTLDCPGCFNPETHDVDKGDLVPVPRLVQQILAMLASIEGITISGGEPLQQFEGVLALLQYVKRYTSLSVVLFTGYSWMEVVALPGASELLGLIDVLVSGRYDQTQRTAFDLRGSANQAIHLLSSRYAMADLACVPTTEVVIGSDGEVVLSGIDPVI
jgi:anaerobic ribonucleoside-triphosphate reductase activating protein